jgi:ADP-dependent phosphofructokinase/glucokinase
MESLPNDALVYYEDAGFYDSRLSQLIWRTLARNISVTGLNEDELQAHLDRKLDLLDPLQIQQALVELHMHIPVPVIVVHSSQWALAYGETATSYSKALKTATNMATTRFRYGDDFTVENYREIESLSSSKENAIFADTLNNLPGTKICCVPVADVEQSNATTIGLGDTFVGGFLLALMNRD